MKNPNYIYHHLRHGFTLVELMAVIAIMAILAAAGATGVVHLVPAYQQRACEEERTQAVRAFVSDWLETRNLAGDDSNMNSVAEKWLSSYLEKNQVNCGRAAESWEINLIKDSSSYEVTISCKTHKGAAASSTVGNTTLDTSGGIKWDGGFDPESSPSP